MKMLTIGQLAKQTGLTTVAIRYYERCLLLPPSERSQAGYRQYPTSILSRINFIQNAKYVGFELKEIKSLLDLQDQQQSSSAVKSQIQKKIAHIQKKIAALQKMKRTLSKLDASCDGSVPTSQCPILKQLGKSQKDS